MHENTTVRTFALFPTGTMQNSLSNTRAELILTVILLIPKVIFSVNTRELSVTP